MRPLEATRIFVEVVRASSFSGAAKKLGLPKSTVSLRVRELEEHLGSDLLTRTTRRLTLTEAGRRYFETSSRILDELADAADLARSAKIDLRGRLRVTAGVDAGIGVFGDTVAAFSALHPELEIDLLLTGQVVDLVAENVDVALRIGKLTDSTLRSRRIGTASFVLVASPAYLATSAALQRPSDLVHHRCLVFSPTLEERTVIEVVKGARRARVVVASRFCANQMSAVRHQALAGRGVAFLPMGALAAELERRTLVEVLPGWRSRPIAIYLVYAQRRYLPRKVQVFVDFVARSFARSPSFNPERAVGV